MAVAKSEWGYKRICQGCGCKFYDMKRDPIVCPSCNTEIDLEALLKSRRPRSAPAKAAKPVKVEPKPAAAAVAETSGGDDDDADEDEVAAAVKDTVLPDDEVLALADDDDDLDADDDEIAEVVVAKDDDDV